PGPGPGGQVDRGRVGTVQPDDVRHCAYHRVGHRGRPGREVMPRRQPRPALGHADQADSASHAKTLLNRPARYGRTIITFRHPGTGLNDRFFAVPLDHQRPDGEQIEVFAREVVAAGKADADLPWLLFLQGGPGFGAQRPGGRALWLNLALGDFRVLALQPAGPRRVTPGNPEA